MALSSIFWTCCRSLNENLSCPERALGREGGSRGGGGGICAGCDGVKVGRGGESGTCKGTLSGGNVRPDNVRCVTAWKSIPGTGSGNLKILIEVRRVASRSVSSRKLIYHLQFSTHQSHSKSWVARLEAKACPMPSKDDISERVLLLIADSSLCFMT